MHWAHKMLVGYILSRLWVDSLGYLVGKMWVCIRSTEPFEFRWLIGFICSLIIIIESEESNFPIATIYLRCCVPHLVVPSCSIICYIYIPGILGFCCHFWWAVYSVRKCLGTLWPAGRLRLCAQYTISLSSPLCSLIWSHWTGICCQVCLKFNDILVNICGSVASTLPLRLWLSWRLCTILPL